MEYFKRDNTGIVALAIILVLTISCKTKETLIFGEMRDDYGVYSIILEKDEFHKRLLGQVGQYVIIEDTGDSKPAHCYPEDIFWIKGKSMPLDLLSASDDFKQKNKQSVKLGRNFKISKAYVLVGQEAIVMKKPNISGDFDWVEFYKEYPKDSALIQFSRVGFNSKKDKAFVNEAISRGVENGGIRFYVLSNDGEGWQIEEVVICASS